MITREQLAIEAENHENALEAVKELDPRQAIRLAYERERLDLDGEPVWFKLYKSQGPGSPSAWDRCESLNEDERIIDAGSFWIVKSDDLGEILNADVEAHPEQWIGLVGEEGRLEFHGFQQGELQENLELWLDDWVEILDFVQARDMDLALRESTFGDWSDIPFRRLGSLGDYRTSVNEREFNEIEAAVDFLKQEAPFFNEGDDLNFAAIMLATLDREGFRFSTSAHNDPDHCGELDNIFDKWAGLN